MSCEKYRDELLEQFGQASPPVKLGAHLASCPECAEFWKSLNEVASLGGENSEFYPESREAELVAEVVEREIRAGSQTTQPPIVTPFGWIKYVAAAAAIVLVSVTATMWKMSGQQTLVASVSDSTHVIAIDTSSVSTEEELPNKVVTTLLEEYTRHASSSAGEELLGDLTDEEVAYLQTKIKPGDLL